jgi:hypothetical protein
MTDSTQKTILECGFLPPNAEFVKQDPRGREYGYFQVVVSAAAAATDPCIRVVKRDQRGILQWACKFDDQISFGHWARECT